MSSKEVAIKIIDQINTLDKHALGSWGYRSIVYSNDSIEFHVNGSKTRPGARIKIKLTAGDLYDIDLYRVVNTNVVYDERLVGIFADQLVEVIDGLVGWKF